MTKANKIAKKKRRLNILVSGSTGQLGQELKFLSEKFKTFNFDFKDRKQLDLSSEKQIKRVLSGRYDYFINAGAYTAVDKAEEEKKLAHIINAKALGHIANYASPKLNIIHVSSDYVYHSNPGRPLLESDKTAPRGVYAKSKLEGEKALMTKRPDSLIIRTSWVYSSYGNNFVKTMLRLGAGRDHLNIVADQYGCPTYARDLAEAILATITNRDVDNYSGLKKGGIYNFSNAGLTNWADFARTIFDYSKIKCTVGETTTKAYNAPAPRPLWSMMSKERIQKDFHIELHDWKKSLKLCLKELKRR